MASNYPPGVTGREYQIAGADREEEATFDCPEHGEVSGWVEYYGGEKRAMHETGPESDMHYLAWESVDELDMGPDPDDLLDAARDRAREDSARA
jgi:hypothetical protein